MFAYLSPQMPIKRISCLLDTSHGHANELSGVHFGHCEKLAFYDVFLDIVEIYGQRVK